jgi:hypothetical protein
MIELIAAIITNRWLADTSVLHHINPVRFRPRLGKRYVARRPRHRDRGASASNRATWRVHESRAGASRAQITRYLKSGHARVPLRSPRGNLDGQWRRSPESRWFAERGGWPEMWGQTHGQPPRTGWVAAMFTPTTVAVVPGGVAVLPGGRGASGAASVDVAPSA